MTRRGVAFLVAAVVLFFLAAATHVGWVRILDAIIWGMLGLSFVLQWLCTTGIAARRRLISYPQSQGLPGPAEDDTLEISTEVKNRRFWPRFFLSVILDYPFERPEERRQRFFVASLPGHGTVSLTSQALCYRRGLHRLDPIVTESKVPFGLLRTRRWDAAPLSILVYPKVLPMTKAGLAGGLRGSSEQPRRARTGHEAVGARHFQPGDPLRHIHWRSTARIRKLAVKELDDTTEESLAIAFSTASDAGEGRDTTLECSIKLAATLGVHAMRAGQAVRLSAGPAQGQWNEAEPFLRELALLARRDGPTMTKLLESVTGVSAVVAIVAEDDREGVAGIVAHASRIPGLIAITLEGFGGPRSGEAADRFRNAGLRVVACRPGRLTETLAELEGFGGGGAAGGATTLLGMQPR
jgi:uncharacterized protein (DUF58 family)